MITHALLEELIEAFNLFHKEFGVSRTAHLLVWPLLDDSTYVKVVEEGQPDEWYRPQEFAALVGNL